MEKVTLTQTWSYSIKQFALAPMFFAGVVGKMWRNMPAILKNALLFGLASIPAFMLIALSTQHISGIFALLFIPLFYTLFFSLPYVVTQDTATKLNFWQVAAELKHLLWLFPAMVILSFVPLIALPLTIILAHYFMINCPMWECISKTIKMLFYFLPLFLVYGLISFFALSSLGFLVAPLFASSMCAHNIQSLHSFKMVCSTAHTQLVGLGNMPALALGSSVFIAVLWLAIVFIMVFFGQVWQQVRQDFAKDF